MNSQNELFSITDTDNLIKVNIYGDESKERICPITGDIWHYIGIMIIPISFENKTLEKIICVRHRVDTLEQIANDSKYFEKNNKIIHFNELKSADEFYISKRWFDFLLDPNESYRLIYINILGINKTKLDLKLFGNNDHFRNIYTRFFRSAIIYALKKFFGTRKIIIKKIYHEIGEQQDHFYFTWNTTLKINEICDDIECSSRKISFIEKNHRLDSKANFLQLLDLFLGVVTNSLHDSTKNKYRVELTNQMFPIIKRMVTEASNIRSSFKHYQRFNISFFPKNSYEENFKITNQFYKKRYLIFKDKISGQLRFDLNFK